jgi:hypothetical protein
VPFEAVEGLPEVLTWEEEVEEVEEESEEEADDEEAEDDDVAPDLRVGADGALLEVSALLIFL